MYNLTDLTLDHIFHANIIAYCQQNQYVRLAIYTGLFTLKYMKDAPRSNWRSTLSKFCLNISVTLENDPVKWSPNSLPIVEKWGASFDKRGDLRNLSADLSRTFERLIHKVLIFHSYNLPKTFSRLIQSKYHLFISTSEEKQLRVDGTETSIGKCEKLLGIKIGKSGVEPHENFIFKEACHKLYHLT